MHYVYRLLFLVSVTLWSACAQLPDNSHRTQSYAPSDTQQTTMARSIEARRKQDASRDDFSGLFLLGNGLDAFVARIVMTRLAERTLDVQYYLYHSDLSGGLLSRELWEAAERGVRVRVLLDDMDLGGRDNRLATLNAHKNIEIRIFNPFIRGKFRGSQFITRFGSVTRRAHNKALIADNQIAIVGGRNVGDEYFSANPDLVFGDLDVAVTNPAAREISAEFDLYWNSSLAYPVETLIGHQPTADELAQVATYFDDFYQANLHSQYLTRLQNSQMLKNAREGNTPYHWGAVTVLYDHPDKITAHRDQTFYNLAPKLKPSINGVKKELIIVSPYFVPGKQGVQLLAALEQKGVDVKVLTNSLMSNDVPIVHAGYSKYRKRLLQAGVQLFELDKSAVGKEFDRADNDKTETRLGSSKSSLHAKYFMMDRRSAFIGSLNLDPRSVIENTEIGVIIDSPSLTQKLVSDFENFIGRVAFEVKLEDGDLVWQRITPNGSVQTFDTEPYSSWWDRFSLGFMKLLPAESQL